MHSEFTIGSFLARWLFAVVLVFGTYNPSAYSYYGWVVGRTSEFGPVMAIAGIALLIAWIVFLRATMESLGILGIVLGSALFACLIWWLIDIDVLSLDSPNELAWLVLLVLSLLLAAGMSWSHISRRLTGQVDVESHTN